MKKNHNKKIDETKSLDNTEVTLEDVNQEKTVIFEEEVDVKTSKFSNWFRTSPTILTIENGIKVSFHYISYILWPIIKLKQITYDKLRHDQQKIVVSLLFLLPIMIGFIFFFAYPLIRSFYMSFGTVEMLREGGIRIHFGEFFLKTGDGGAYNFLDPDPAAKNIFYNYVKIFTQSDVDFPIGLVNTVWSTFIDTIVITIFSLLIAVMLNGNFKGRGFVRAIFFLPVVFNSEAVTLALESSASVSDLVGAAGNNALSQYFNMQMFFQNLGIPTFLTTFLGDITSAIYSTISFSGIQILIFLAAIQSVPRHLYEAAKIEGATAYESFWKITLPMVSPMVIPIVVYTIVDSFLRSDINTIINTQYANSDFGMHAAMSWSYVIASTLLLALMVGILSKVVFYHDDKK